MRVTLGNSVTVARQTLTLFVGVRIPIPQPSRVFITDSSCEHSIFYFSYIFEQVLSLLFLFSADSYAEIFFEIYSTATPCLVSAR